MTADEWLAADCGVFCEAETPHPATSRCEVARWPLATDGLTAYTDLDGRDVVETFTAGPFVVPDGWRELTAKDIDDYLGEPK